MNFESKARILSLKYDFVEVWFLKTAAFWENKVRILRILKIKGNILKGGNLNLPLKSEARN